MEVLKTGKYQHYKGQYYHVIGVAKHSETLEPVVVYECLYDNPISKLWIRPLAMFLENVKVQGKIIPRFRYISE